MKKIKVVLGIGILALTLLSFVGKGECQKSKERKAAETALSELQQPFIHQLIAQNEIDLLSVKSIVVVNNDEEIDLGFDTKAYLPIGFNAYAGMELDPNEIDFIELEEEIELGFDTAEYLPANFDPYLGMNYEQFNTL